MKKGVCRGKRGLSPVIASVLLIALVLVLASIIFMWARGFISEQIEKFGNPVDTVCNQIDFDIERISGSAGDELEVVNRGNIPIYHLDIKKISGGDAEVEKFKFDVDEGDAVRKSVDLKMKDGTRPEKVIVYPALLGTVKGKQSNKVFTCTDHGETLIL
jgi:flagellin-like protein